METQNDPKQTYQSVWIHTDIQINDEYIFVLSYASLDDQEWLKHVVKPVLISEGLYVSID
jgi:hypothetical protein